jgi:hypothetical protein
LNKLIESPYRVLEDRDDVFTDSIVSRMREGGRYSLFELRKYRNVIEWTTKGLGLDSIYTHVRQYQILRDFFGLRCPHCNKGDIDCWGKSADELKSEILLVIDWDREVFVCEKCGYVLNRLPYDTLVVCAGMRSGKTVLAAIAATYVFLMTLLVKNLDQRFGLIPGQLLRGSMVSTTQTQTQKTVWVDFLSLLRSCRDKFVRNLILTKESDIHDVDGLTREWKIDNTEFLSLHSNSSSLAGGTGMFVVLEEYSRFLTGTTSARSAGEVRTVLTRSMKTLRSLAKTAVDDLFTLMIVIGSPFYNSDDPILSLIYEDGDTSKPLLRVAKQISYHYPTWLFNPLMKRSDFNTEYTLDFATAERDYGANPVVSATRFFEDVNALPRCVVIKEDCLRFSVYKKQQGPADFLTAKVDPSGIFGREYCVHIDLGEVDNFLSMAFARTENGKVFVDGILCIKPSAGISAYIDTPVDILLELRTKVTFRFVSFDQWQSASGLQRLIGAFIPCGKMSVGERELVSFKNLVYQNLIEISDAQDGGCDVLLEEARKLTRNAGKISHVDALVSVAGAVKSAYSGFDHKKIVSTQKQNTQFRNFKPQVIQSKIWK